MTAAPRSITKTGIERTLRFTHADFHKIAAVAYQHAGIHFGDGKEALIYSRLAKRLRSLGLTEFSQYIDLLTGAGNEQEVQKFVSALTTNTTHFFRENHHFEQLANEVLPPLLAQARKGARVRFWSSACSSGEEAYCIAFTILDQCPEAAGLDIKILATDIDATILGTAIRGVYSSRATARLPPTVVQKYLEPTQDNAQTCRIRDAVSRMVSFRQMNLALPWPVKGPFDAVFCRNVVIYFDAATQERVWHQFASVIPVGGYLFTGHSERLSASVRPCFEIAGNTVHRRTAYPMSHGNP
jgi:chemotaxis protein methyltransferase CheR